MSVFDCRCFDADTGKTILKMITTLEKVPEDELPDGLSMASLDKLKKDVKTCNFDGPKGGGGDGAKAKTGRKLSEYQIFLGDCMRSEEKGGRALPMKECITEWKAKKG
jgi:hypothetical protein